MWKGLKNLGKLEGTQRAGWECHGPTIFNISMKVLMGLTEPAVNLATSCQFQEYFYRDAEIAPGWPEAKIQTQCAWHDHGEQIDSEGPLLLGKNLMSSELMPATATLYFSELMPVTMTLESGLAKATLNFWPKATVSLLKWITERRKHH